MRILNLYIAKSFMVVFTMTLGVLMFVMALTNLLRLVDFFARGISGMVILKIFTYGMPFSLIFAIPISVLGAAYLVFSRMASDNEIVAMKSCGIGVWQIIFFPAIISTLLSLLCVYINWDIAPKSHLARREIVQTVKVEAPLSLLDEGRFIDDFPGYKIYIASREGVHLDDIIIYEFDDDGIRRTIRADTGTVSVDESGKIITVDLFDVRIDQADEAEPGTLAKTRHLTAGHYPISIDVNNLIRSGKIWKNRSNLTMSELFTGLREGVTTVMPGVLPEEEDTMRAAFLVEIHTRLGLSVSSFVFLLLGAALGIKIHRKESSIGIGLTLVLVFVFYFFIIIADSLVSRPELRPHLIVWIPVLISIAIGIRFIERN